jgi:hypothetical protein
LITQNVLGERYKLWSSRHPFVVQIFSSDTCNLCFSLNVQTHMKPYAKL